MIESRIGCIKIFPVPDDVLYRLCLPWNIENRKSVLSFTLSSQRTLDLLICDTRNGNNRDHVVVQKCLNSGSISGPIVISNKIGSLHVQNITIRAARKLNSHGILSGRRKTFKWWSKFFLPFTNIFHTNQI